MSYTRTAYNTADATWQGESTYTRQAYNAADATFFSAYQPDHGNLSITGGTSSLAIGFQSQSSADSLTITGYQPTSVFFVPFIDQSVSKNLILSGDTPLLSIGWSLAADDGDITISGNTPRHPIFKPSNPDTITITGDTPIARGGFSKKATNGLIVSTEYTPSFFNRTSRIISNNWLKTTYTLTIIGGNNNVDDIVVPMSSFQIRYNRLPYSEYLSCVINGADAYADEIIARIDGRLIINRYYHYQNDNIESYQVINVPFSDIRTDQGGRAGITATLTGRTMSQPYRTPINISLNSPVSKSLNNGTVRYRCELNPLLRPGDTVTINGDTFVIDSQTVIVNTKSAYVEIGGILNG